ncbi:hypothetical protein GOV05_00425 [Candidatus Woesearchaeota archaeon]|nr:hypothetical protein [Candidatus Woesearchaeota archaeon]
MTQNSETIQLGEKIVLGGFSEVDGASMIILKKIIGNYTRRLIESNPGFEKIEISLDQKKTGFETMISLTIKKEAKEYANKDKNLFVSIDGAFKKIK